MSDSEFNVGDKVTIVGSRDVGVVFNVSPAWDGTGWDYDYDVLFSDGSILGLSCHIVSEAKGLNLVKWYLDQYEIESELVDDINLFVAGSVLVFENVDTKGSFDLEWSSVGGGIRMGATRDSEVVVARTVVAVLEGM